MALQIANPVVVEKIRELARISGTTKTAAVEQAVDRMLRATKPTDTSAQSAKLYALLAQLDRIAQTPKPSIDIVWDEFGLPK